MATLKIRKSENEVIELPLTTEKPIARSLAVFYNGRVYYNPLVRAKNDLDSGVIVRCEGTNYALSTSLYDPELYANDGATWTSTGNPAVHERGYLELDGSSYLTRDEEKFSLAKDSYFEFRCTIRPTALRGITQVVFNMYTSSSTYISLFINTSNKLCVSLSGTAVKTSSTALSPNTRTDVGVWYSNGKFDLICDGYLGEVSKNIPSGNYTMRIGANASGENRFIGKIDNVCLDGGGESFRMRFGN